MSILTAPPHQVVGTSVATKQSRASASALQIALEFPRTDHMSNLHCMVAFATSLDQKDRGHVP